MTANNANNAQPRQSGRILFVIGSLDVGGTERHLALIAPALKKRGWTPTIFCHSRRGVQADSVVRQGVAVIAPQFGGDSPSLRVVRFARISAACVKLLAIMVWQRPAIAHFFLPMSYILGGPLAIVSRVPIRIMSRRSRNLYQKRYPFISRLESFLHRHMTCILGNSRAVIEDLRSEGCSPEKLRLIYNGVDPHEMNSVAPATPRDPSKLILVIVANLIPYKGHADLIRALSGIRDSLLQPWELWCVGRDDGVQADVAQLADSLGVGNQISFLGQRNDVPSLLKAADIGILCSHEEGFANAILEAMAAGLPMVVTDVGGNAEVVVHGETGLVVPPHDPAALGKAILHLARHPEARKQMAEKGRKRVLTQFSLERCVQQYSDLYGELQKSTRRQLPPS